MEIEIDELLDIITSDELNTKDEEDVLDLVLKWLNHDIVNRKKVKLKIKT